MRHDIYLGAAVMAACLFGTAAQAQTTEQRVTFDSVPGAVQDALTNYASGESNGAAASVWRGTDRGHVLYTGRVVDVDGSSRIIDVDEAGQVRAMHQFAAPLMRAFDSGQVVPWTTLSPGVQKTVADNSGGGRITSIVQKTASNGMPIFVATTADMTGLPFYIETTIDGELIGVKRRPD